MRIAFGEISGLKTSCTVTDSSWLPSDELEVVVPLVAKLELQSIDAVTVALRGVLQGAIRLACCRCGEPVACGVDEAFFYRLTTQEEEISPLPEKECNDEECDTLYLREPCIEIGDILCEQIRLALPAKPLCRVDCRGLCPRCGGSYDQNDCTCGDPDTDSPFKVLEQLKKNMKQPT
ncbi:MAG: YceD family protein [Desulfopila sp.]